MHHGPIVPPPSPPPPVVHHETVRTVYVETPPSTVRSEPPRREPVRSEPVVHVHNEYHVNEPMRGGFWNSAKALIAVAVVLLLILCCTFLFSSGKSPASTMNREKLDVNHSYQTNLVYDELEWIDTGKVSRSLKQFYDKTGIQPALAIFDYIDGVTGDEAASDEYAKNWYDRNIDGEGAMLLAYFDTGTDEEGWAFVVYGDTVKSVMDAEAEDIFWSFYDRYWTDTSIDLTDAYPAMFNKTADRIMQRTTTGNDLLKVFLRIVLVVAAGIVIIRIMKLQRQHEAERAAETERILSKPLGKMDSSSGSGSGGSSDPLLDKYKD